MTLDDLKKEKPFSYHTTKSGQVRLSYRGKIVASLCGADAVKFIAKVECDSNSQAQRVMAKATGNFKRGNEKQSRK